MLCIKLKRKLEMFRILNKKIIVGNCRQLMLPRRNLLNSCCTKLNSASRINSCVTKPAYFNNADAGFRAESELQRKLFHVTAARQALPPVIIIILRPLSKVAAILFGRAFRKWWRALPPDRKRDLILRLKKNRIALLASGALVSTGVVWYYYSHLEKDPITGRRKFIAINKEQLMQLAQIELVMQRELHKDHFLPPAHPAYRRVVTVANQLLRSNREILQLRETNWIVTVVNEPSVTNAFVLPNGHIFVFTGILNLCTNDDQLCVILAHEISHVLLSHMAEQFSSLHLLDLLVLVPLALIWAVLPEAAAVIAHWLSGYFTKVLFQLPFSRALEAEADEIGLQLTAKACYDVREASVFWAKMSSLDLEFEWLSTHPSSETRQFVLESLMPTAIQLREKCKCPKLPPVDPRMLMGIHVP